MFAFLTLLETFSSVLLYWFPPYYSLKLAFLLYLFLPHTKGATFVYDQFLAPFLRRQFPEPPAGSAAPPVRV